MSPLMQQRTVRIQQIAVTLMSNLTPPMSARTVAPRCSSLRPSNAGSCPVHHPRSAVADHEHRHRQPPLTCFLQRPLNTGSGSARPMAPNCAFLPASWRARLAPCGCNRPTKGHRHPDDEQLCRSVPESSDSNPHSTIANIDHIASSRGFLHRGL